MILLTIAIISGITTVWSILYYAVKEEQFNVGVGYITIFVLSVWGLCFPLAIIALSIAALVIIVAIFNKNI